MVSPFIFLRGLFGQLDAKIGKQILDELVYKLSATSSAEIARLLLFDFLFD